MAQEESPAIQSPPKSTSIFRSVSSLFTPKDAATLEQEKQAKERGLAEKKAQEEAQEALELQKKTEEEAARLEEQRIEQETAEALRVRREKEFTEAQRSRIDELEKAAIKKKEDQKIAKLKAVDIDNADRLTNKTKTILFATGPVVGILYLLAWAFPAFSAAILAIVIAAVVSTTAYFSYKLYIRGIETIQQISDVASDLEVKTVPELRVRVEGALDNITKASIDGAEALREVTKVAQQFPKDVAGINQSLGETQAEILKAVPELLKLLDSLSTNTSKSLSDALLEAKVQIEKVTLAARQSYARKTYDQTITGLERMSEFNQKGQQHCASSMLSKKTAFIAKSQNNTDTIACKFLDDNNVLCNITIAIPNARSRTIANIASEDSGIILKELNLHIVRKDTEENVDSLRRRLEEIEALQKQAEPQQAPQAAAPPQAAPQPEVAQPAAVTQAQKEVSAPTNPVVFSRRSSKP